MGTVPRFSAALVAASFVLLPTSANAQDGKTTTFAMRFDLARPEIVAFAQGVASRNDALDERTVLEFLAEAEPQPKIVELISRPAERVLPWWEYRERFVTEQRIREGVEFWCTHEDLLHRVAAEHGVAPEYVLGILGAETYYGRITGRDRVIDALATLAFDYPPRGEFFRGELEQFMLLVREEAIDPKTATGSYAGAMGAAQFMPSSYRRYAVDASGDRKRDLWKDWEDVIASVANYLKEHGWDAGAPVLSEVELDPDPTFTIDPRNLDLNETVDSLRATGVRIVRDVPADTPVVLVSAEQRDGPGYRVGFKNFHVITRYNRSARYAMAVHELAQAIAARRQATPAP